VRDVTFGEDHSQVRTDHGPTNLACLRTLAINALRLTIFNGGSSEGC
jgi:predicted transposase YbfD/YdcC